MAAIFLKWILISLFVFFSLSGLSQQEKKDSTDIPVLSMKDLRQITTSLQDLPAKDWLRICKAIDDFYFKKLKAMQTTMITGEGTAGNKEKAAKKPD